MPGDIYGINCTVVGSNKIAVGQPLEGDIQVKILDKYGNEIDVVCSYCVIRERLSAI